MLRELIMTSKECENHCPKCNSEDIKWDSIVVGDNVIYYPATCYKCGCEFKEYFQYSDTDWQD